MNLIRQVVTDLFKEIGWVLLYGMLTAMVIITLVLAALSYRQVAAQSGAIGRFVDGNVSVVQVKETAYQLAELPHKEADAPKESMPLEEYYAKALSPDGKAGTYAVLNGYHGYQQIILLLGVYTDLTPYTPGRDADVVFAVTNDLKEQAEKTIQIGGGNCYIRTAPNTTGKILGVAHNGDKLPYGGETSDGGWLMIEHDGQNAWVSGKYGKLID